jgi:hypothetical protein
MSVADLPRSSLLAARTDPSLLLSYGFALPALPALNIA